MGFSWGDFLLPCFLKFCFLLSSAAAEEVTAVGEVPAAVLVAALVVVEGHPAVGNRFSVPLIAFFGRDGCGEIGLQVEIILHFVFFTDLLQYLAIGK